MLDNAHPDEQCQQLQSYSIQRMINADNNWGKKLFNICKTMRSQKDTQIDILFY